MTDIQNEFVKRMQSQLDRDIDKAFGIDTLSRNSTMTYDTLERILIPSFDILDKMIAEGKKIEHLLLIVPTAMKAHIKGGSHIRTKHGGLRYRVSEHIASDTCYLMDESASLVPLPKEFSWMETQEDSSRMTCFPNLKFPT